MYRWPRWRGGPVLNAAISGVEVALWDILGKLLDVPVYKLLGGAARDKIRLYQASSGAEGVLAVKELGFTATKTGVSGLTRPLKRPWDVKAAAKNFEEMRLAVGDDFDIGTDAHGNCTPIMALEYCKAIEDFRPMWIEEPVQVEAYDALEWLGNHTTVPMATGERHFTKWDFEDMISRHIVNYVQPDVIICGGISETKKIAAMAEAQFIEVAIHNPGSLVGTLASLHVDACTSNCVIQEFKYKYVEPSGWQEDLFYGTRINYKDGFAMLPDKPGIGTDMDEKVAEKHLVTMEEDANPQTYFEDGSVRDH